MTKKSKPSTLKQVFNAWIKVRKKEAELYALRSQLQSITDKADPDSALVSYEDGVYRVSVSSRWNGSHDYNIQKIAILGEIENLN